MNAWGQTLNAAALAAARRPAFGRWIAFGLVIAFMALIGWKLRLASLGQVSSGPAPDFTLTLFDGGTLRLSDQRGKVVMVDFWASWCVPCQQEARMLERLWQEYRGRGVVFVGVDYLDPENDARAFLERYGITYPNGAQPSVRSPTPVRFAGQTASTIRCDASLALRIEPTSKSRCLHMAPRRL